ncbi:hypothetical protein [Actinomycetospora sp.]|uniref:hypothetical protein n=1 Tax=Actinomycetospora sp. TaxID=1872135 RepID=UPI002F407798
MPTPLALDLATADAAPVAATSDHSGLIALGVVVASAVVALWRVLLRLLLVALVALVVIGLGVVMTPDLAVSPPPPPGISRTPTPGPAPTPLPNPQRAQTG